MNSKMVDKLYKFLKAHTHKGLRRAVGKLYIELSLSRKHFFARKRLKNFTDVNLKFNMGCGRYLKEGWFNIDIGQKNCINLDLRERLPFSDGIASQIYSEHFFEHQVFPVDALTFLHESFRMLCNGGLFSIGVPDGQILLESYCNGTAINDFEIKATLPENPTSMQLVNVLFRNFGHQYIYDYETLAKILREVGFINVTRRPFDPSMDSEHRRDWTLYIDAYKP